MKLGDVPDAEWDSFARLGFDIVWLMGVWQRSPESRLVALADPANTAGYDRALPGWKPSDVIRSPYSVAGYVPDPRIGTWDDLDRARGKLRARGIALFLDFVGNHTALDHPWTREHPGILRARHAKGFRKGPRQLLSRGNEKGAFISGARKGSLFPAVEGYPAAESFRAADARGADLPTCGRLPAIATACAAIWRCCI